MKITHTHRSFCRLVASCALVAGALSLSADAGAAPVRTVAPDCHDAGSDNLLAGPWTFAASDLTPNDSYTVNGDELDLHWSGYYSWNGTWDSGFAGYSFTQPAPLEAGATYALTLTVANVSLPIPVVLEATLDGAGAQQSATLFSAGTQTLTFTVADPGATPTVTLVAHPALGHVGPLYNTGILYQSYTVTATLTRTN